MPYTIGDIKTEIQFHASIGACSTNQKACERLIRSLPSEMLVMFDSAETLKTISYFKNPYTKLMLE